MPKARGKPSGRAKREGGHFLTRKDEAVQWFQREDFTPDEFIGLLHSERELDQARSELTQLNEYCKQEVQKVVHAHHKDFLEASRDLQDVEALVDELRNYVSGSAAVVASLADLPPLPKQVPVLSQLQLPALPGAAQQPQQPPGAPSGAWGAILALQAELLQDLQVATAERDFATARALLAAGRDVIAVVERDADQLAEHVGGEGLPGWRSAFEGALAAAKAALVEELTRQLAVTNSSTLERRSAAQTLGLLVGPSRATQALLHCHTLRVRAAQQHLLKQHSAAGGDPDGVEYAGGLAQRTFLAIGTAAEDVRAVFPAPPPAASASASADQPSAAGAAGAGAVPPEPDAAAVLPSVSALVVEWAGGEAVECAALLCRHALTPFAATGAAVGALLCVGLAVVFCAALELSHGLALRAVFLGELWPLLEAIVRRHLHRLRDDAAAAASVDATNAALKAIASSSPPPAAKAASAADANTLNGAAGAGEQIGNGSYPLPLLPTLPALPALEALAGGGMGGTGGVGQVPSPLTASAAAVAYAPAGLTSLPMLLPELRALAEGLAPLGSAHAAAMLRQGVAAAFGAVCEQIHGSLSRLVGSAGAGAGGGAGAGAGAALSGSAGPGAAGVRDGGGGGPAGGQGQGQGGQGARLAAYVASAVEQLRRFAESDVQAALAPLAGIAGPVAPPDLLLPYLEPLSDLLATLPPPPADAPPPGAVAAAESPRHAAVTAQRQPSSSPMDRMRAELEEDQERREREARRRRDREARAAEEEEAAQLSQRQRAAGSSEREEETGAAPAAESPQEARSEQAKRAAVAGARAYAGAGGSAASPARRVRAGPSAALEDVPEPRPAWTDEQYDESVARRRRGIAAAGASAANEAVAPAARPKSRPRQTAAAEVAQPADDSDEGRDVEAPPAAGARRRPAQAAEAERGPAKPVPLSRQRPQPDLPQPSVASHADEKEGAPPGGAPGRALPRGRRRAAQQDTQDEWGEEPAAGWEEPAVPPARAAAGNGGGGGGGGRQHASGATRGPVAWAEEDGSAAPAADEGGRRGGRSNRVEVHVLEPASSPPDSDAWGSRDRSRQRAGREQPPRGTDPGPPSRLAGKQGVAAEGEVKGDEEEDRYHRAARPRERTNRYQRAVPAEPEPSRSRSPSPSPVKRLPKPRSAPELDEDAAAAREARKTAAAARPESRARGLRPPEAEASPGRYGAKTSRATEAEGARGSDEEKEGDASEVRPGQGRPRRAEEEEPGQAAAALTRRRADPAPPARPAAPRIPSGDDDDEDGPEAAPAVAVAKPRAARGRVPPEESPPEPHGRSAGRPTAAGSALDTRRPDKSAGSASPTRGGAAGGGQQRQVATMEMATGAAAAAARAGGAAAEASVGSAVRRPNRFGVVLSDDDEGVTLPPPRLRRPRATGVASDPSLATTAAGAAVSAEAAAAADPGPGPAPRTGAARRGVVAASAGALADVPGSPEQPAEAVSADARATAVRRGRLPREQQASEDVAPPPAPPARRRPVMTPADSSDDEAAARQPGRTAARARAAAAATSPSPSPGGPATAASAAVPGASAAGGGHGGGGGGSGGLGGRGSGGDAAVPGSAKVLTARERLAARMAAKAAASESRP